MDLDSRPDLAHGGAPYQGRARRANPKAGTCLVILFVAWVASVARAEEYRLLVADGKAKEVRVAAPGAQVLFGFEARAGCRYRVAVRPGTLLRPVFELDVDGNVFARADAGSSGAEAAHEFDCERDGGVFVRVGGFSAMTGAARVRVETLDPEGRPVASHRRFLPEGGMLARVGDLWIGEPNRWELVVPAGVRCEVRSQPGTAGPLAIRVLDASGAVVAETGEDAEAYPSLRFEAPAPVPPEKPGGVARLPVLEVRSLRGGGGTYGVRLQRVSGGEPAPAPPPAPAPEGAPSRIDGERFGFRLASGDVAALFLPQSPADAPHVLQVLEEGEWSMVPDATVHARGEWCTARTPEGGAIVVFRAHLPGSYRFLEPMAPREAVLPTLLFPAARSTGAPVLTGTGVDARVLARAGGAWKALGLGACAPGGDYLFVASGSGSRDLSLRVVGLDGKVLASRLAGDPARTEVPGMGPSLRFRVHEPTLARLEVMGRGWKGYAVLRRASN